MTGRGTRLSDFDMVPVEQVIESDFKAFVQEQRSGGANMMSIESAVSSGVYFGAYRTILTNYRLFSEKWPSKEGNDDD